MNFEGVHSKTLLLRTEDSKYIYLSSYDDPRKNIEEKNLCLVVEHPPPHK